MLLYAARRVTSQQLIEQYIPDHNIVAVKTELIEGAPMVQSDLATPEWALYDAFDGQSSV